MHRRVLQQRGRFRRGRVSTLDNSLTKSMADSLLPTGVPTSDEAPLPPADSEDQLFCSRCIAAGDSNLPGATEEAKKKRTKVYSLRPEDVEMMLEFGQETTAFPETTNIDLLAKEETVYEDLSAAVSMAQAFALEYDDGIRAVQEKVRREVLAKGYAT